MTRNLKQRDKNKKSQTREKLAILNLLSRIGFLKIKTQAQYYISSRILYLVNFQG